MSVANPAVPGQVEDYGHVGNPSKHATVASLAADVDITALLGGPSVAIYVGTSAPGDLTVVDIHGNSATYKNVPAGTYVPGLFVTIDHTTTTVADLVVVGK